MEWTNDDIDAAFAMGIMNGDAIELPEGTTLPALSKITIELKRLKKMGYARPHEAVRAIRYGCKAGHNFQDTEDGYKCVNKGCGIRPRDTYKPKDDTEIQE